MTDPTTAPCPTSKLWPRRNPGSGRFLTRFGRGPAAALRYGIDQAQGEVVVVTMADGSDDPHQIDQLTRLVERGVAVAAASRYMRGGQQVGGPWLKGMISRSAGISLDLLGRVGTHDPTNSFKAYSRQFLEEVGIDSDAGFTLGIELVAKAKRRGLPVAEIPTIWLDRADGTSNFRVEMAGSVPEVVALRPQAQRSPSSPTSSLGSHLASQKRGRRPGLTGSGIASLAPAAPESSPPTACCGGWRQGQAVDGATMPRSIR